MRYSRMFSSRIDLHIISDISVVFQRVMTASPRAVVLMCVLGIGLCNAGCGGNGIQEQTIPFRPDLNDPRQQKVLDFQDRQLTDSLSPYLSHEDPTLRYRAAMAFASFRDSTVVHSLGRLLKDTNPAVRQAAAFALGQSRGRQAEEILIAGFDQYDSLGIYAKANAAILEAVGKTGGEGNLKNLCAIKSYDIRDSVLILGQARGIYRYALRGITSPDGTRQMVDFLASGQLPSSIRVIAANYLFRARGINTTEHLSTLIPVFRQDRDPRIRMCLATAIGKSQDRDGLGTLRNQLKSEPDYRVQCNILRALAFYPYNDVKEIAFDFIYDKNIHVAKTAANYLADNGTPGDAQRFRAIARGQLPWEVRTLLYLATERYMSRAYQITKGNMQHELIDWFNRSNNPYEKAAILHALSGDATNLTAIKDLGFKHDHPAVRTAAVTAIGDIALGEDLQAAYSGQLGTIRRQIASILIEAINSGDVAMIAVASGIFADERMHDVAKSHLDLLQNTLSSIELPAGIETYNALGTCIASLQGQVYIPRKPDYNHPVDWPAVAALGDTVRAEIITSSGTIVIDLFVGTAPATVQNFVSLARNRFFHGKNFHRVVPNFVIQGGCPRGDGYGSLDYTIRSELQPLYYGGEGYVGMASAGNHTEGTQWFVTHSPTPHLDGNYTLFGRVKSGMDVVHGIQVGDEIREVNVLVGSGNLRSQSQ